jgi:hypothetical protein
MIFGYFGHDEEAMDIRKKMQVSMANCRDDDSFLTLSPGKNRENYYLDPPG